MKKKEAKQNIFEYEKKTYETISEKEKINKNKIDVCSSSIKEIKKEIMFCHKIKILIICCNKITELPKELFFLKKLEVLSLGNNFIKKIPREIKLLKKLKELHLENNQLIEVPKEVSFLSKLNFLDLSYNKIENINQSFGQLKNLKFLYLKSTEIKYLPIEIALIRELKCIDLTGSPLYERVKTKEKISKNCQNTHIKNKYNFLKKTSSCCKKDLKEHVPSLCQIIARKIQKNETLPLLLEKFFLTKGFCSYCKKPFFSSSYIYRIRFVVINNQKIPFYYLLCSRHWDNEEERIELMVEVKPSLNENFLN